MIKRKPLINSITLLVAVLVFSIATKSSFAQSAQQESTSSWYVPLIGITAVPNSLTLPKGGGEVTYQYAVKNFLKELPLSTIQVTDDTCRSVQFLEGDDNGNEELDANETWRYSCTVSIVETTQSIATVTGTINDVIATHKAYSTVAVGVDSAPPLVSIVNITKIAYPLSLTPEGGVIHFTYKVNNPGIVPLRNVTVVDDKCRTMSSKLGDTNGNNLLDTNEVWVYTCTMFLKETTTNTATVTAFSNGFKATGETTLTVKVAQAAVAGDVETILDIPTQTVPGFPETGADSDFKIIVWAILSGVLAGLITFLFLSRISRMREIDTILE
ncbi:MAG: hypothetical protein Q8P93_00850 [bacterium]|nr:hypothetical protein [bacterium]